MRSNSSPPPRLTLPFAGDGTGKRLRVALPDMPQQAGTTRYWTSGEPETFDTKHAILAAVAKQEAPLHQVSVTRNRGGFSNVHSARVVCSHGKECSFSVNVREHSSSWFVTSFNAAHSCVSLPTPDKAKGSRARNYNYQLVMEALGED